MRTRALCSSQHVFRSVQYCCHLKRLYTPKASVFQCVGLFLGNRDRDTEIVHKLLDPVTGKPGILAAQIKLQPLGRREGGFCGRKSMRVAIYGFAVPEVSSSGLQRDSRALPESRDTTIDNQEEDRADVTQSSPGESHIFDSSVSGVILKVIQAPVHKNNGFRVRTCTAHAISYPD